MALASGELRHRVEIQKPSTNQDANTGEMKVSWRTLAFVFAKVEPKSARQFMAADAEQAEVSGTMTVRFRPDIDATMRVIHRGQAHDILGVLPDPVSGLEYMVLPISQGVRVT